MSRMGVISISMDDSRSRISLQHVHHEAQVVEVDDLAVQLVVRDADVLDQVEHLLARLLVQLRRVLHLPLARLVAQLQLEVGRVERERADVVHRRDRSISSSTRMKRCSSRLVVLDLDGLVRMNCLYSRSLSSFQSQSYLANVVEVLAHLLRCRAGRPSAAARRLMISMSLPMVVEERLALVLGHVCWPQSQSSSSSRAPRPPSG